MGGDMAESISERCRRRVSALDWRRIRAALDADGYARIPSLLNAAECRSLVALYADDTLFRSRVVMERHRFGRGEYKYFARPLPPLVAALRAALYPRLARVANRWAAALGDGARFPESHARFLARCRASGQERPTPLLLDYSSGDYNRLHQDLYGEVAFPLQLTCMLRRPDVDFCGGEFLLVEQQARTQARGDAIALAHGEAIVFPTRERPVPGRRGFTRAKMRHGVSRIRSGRRTALGIIFHDAR
jgi:hypothetical protein